MSNLGNKQLGQELATAEKNVFMQLDKLESEIEADNLTPSVLGIMRDLLWWNNRRLFFMKELSVRESAEI